MSEKLAAPVSSRYRNISGAARIVSLGLTTTSIVAAIYYIFRISIANFVFVDTGYYFFLHALLLPLVYFYFPVTSQAPRDRVPWYDWGAAGLSFGTALYFFVHAFDILLEGWEVGPPEAVWAIALIFFLLSLEAARRTGGWGLFFVVVFFAFLPLYTGHMPGIFRGLNFSFYRMVSFHVMGPDGLIGLPVRVLGELLIGFLIFGAVMAGTGGGKFFLDLALSLFGRFRGGAAKVAIFASGLFGTLSGSATSNVITTGTLTIPAMKKSGFLPHVAGAVETTASCGGVLMPPVMGAVAFIMALWLNISYLQVIVAAAVPSFLYYFSLFIQVDSLAAVQGLRGIPKEELPPVGQVLKEGWFYVFAFFLLVYTLVVLRQEGKAPFYASAAILALTMMRKATRIDFAGFVLLIERTGRSLCEIVGMLLGVALIVSSMTYTGIAVSFSKEVTLLAGGSLYLLVLLGAVASFILGMGLPMVACYVFLALVLAPALVHVGLHPIAVHLFVLYGGILSLITPPLCVPAFVAAGIAGAHPMKTGWMAMRIGIALFFLPFFFVLNPALVAQGELVEILYRLIFAAFGLALIAWGVEGYVYMVGKVGLVTKGFLVCSGLLLAFPHWLADATGGIMALMTIAVQYSLKNRGHLHRKMAQ